MEDSYIKDSYIRDCILNLFETTYSNDFEKLKAIYYGLADVLDSLVYLMETEQDTQNIIKLTNSLKIIYDVLESNK